ncbi:MAG: hypothetical protein K2P58_09320 [Hyphomonadaceae bacterium]|nr:hypothetical protein [Hyphomonadaceae bacterium]
MPAAGETDWKAITVTIVNNDWVTPQMFAVQAWLRQQFSRRVWLGVVGPILGFFAATLTLGIVLLTHFAHQQNKFFADTTTQLVSNALEERATALGELTLDYANWDAAFAAVTGRIDRAWLDENYYSWVVDGMIVLDENGAVPFAWFSDELGAVATLVKGRAIVAARRIVSTADLAHAPQALSAWRTGYTSINGRLALIAVAAISPEDNAQRLALADTGLPRHRLVSVKILEPAEIAALGESLAIANLQFHPARRSAPVEGLYVELEGAQGPMGLLAWRDDRPGGAAFARMAWLAVACLLLFAGIAAFVARRLVVTLVGSNSREQAALESSRLKSEFIATMSHELRTPLNAIIGYTELIEEEAHGNRADVVSIRADAARVRAAAQHLTKLIGDILDQSRIEAGEISLEIESLSVSDLLAETKELAEPLAKANGNRLMIAVDSRAESVAADYVRLRQCLANLAGNAVKFTRGGTVTLSARPVMRNGAPFVAIDVIDTGIGIAAPDLAKFFAPFTQAGPGIQRRYGGTGLGLSIARKLAIAMGGDIVAESEAGAGSTFTLFLPAPAQATEASAARSVSTI